MKYYSVILKLLPSDTRMYKHVIVTAPWGHAKIPLNIITVAAATV
jgi:hypothetical protein